jgi:hypothetical protein
MARRGQRKWKRAKTIKEIAKPKERDTELCNDASLA